ncbi:MAG: macro domain-containing protein [Proteobacteria bacterium]|nr:macro domain-containing protein [Pseudomonadota bacterium]MCK4868975.1 macro domain-containing protein [Alphaproteobacteria bacterium]
MRTILGGGNGADEPLKSCYRNSMALAHKVDVQAIAFPAISTGIYRLPLDRAAHIAVAAVATDVYRAVPEGPES